MSSAPEDPKYDLLNHIRILKTPLWEAYKEFRKEPFRKPSPAQKPNSPRRRTTPQFRPMGLSEASLGEMWQDSTRQSLSYTASAVLGSHSVPGFVKCVLTLFGGLV